MRSLVRSSLLAAFCGTLALANVALAANATVNIRNSAFVPATVRIQPNDSVTWRNQDVLVHSIQWTSGGLTGSMPLASGQEHSQSFAGAGTYTYVCGIHGALMSGSVVVGAATTPPPPTRTPPQSASPSPSASPSQSAAPSATPSTASGTPRPSGSPSATPSASPAAAPVSQANTLIGVALIAVGVAILAGALWWRFGG